ncbi:MAG: hypothetical protein IT436_05640 [Phycisphaerales bacterium]|nr:hypothetical protein [Phycisphaerales bacterium]
MSQQPHPSQQPPKLPSLLDADMAAVGQPAKGKANIKKAAPARKSAGRTMDAAWSKRKKAFVGALAAVGGVAALSFGFWKAWSMTAPGLPTSASQAVAIINSARFDNLDEARKDQFVEETQRLIRALPDDERRALRDDPRFRDAMMRMREEQMDENAKRFARGQELENMGFGPGGRGGQPPTEEQRKEWEKMRKEWEDRQAKMTEEEKQKQEEERQRRQEEMRKRMDERLGAAINTGSAQSMGLRTEMFKRMARQGGGRMFGGGGRGPGGPGGGRGPGGGGGGPR